MATVTDEIIDLHDRILGKLFNAAKDAVRLTARLDCDMHSGPPHYPRHRFPAEIIGHAVWLYFRFTLSYRDIEELLASRGVEVSYETIRQWCLKFGQSYANALRQSQPKRGDKWHIDEVYLTLNGKLH